MFSRMTNRTMAAVAALVLLVAVVGCSNNSSPVAPMTDNTSVINKAPIGDRSDSGNSFSFTGVISKVDMQERMVAFDKDGPTVYIDKTAKARVLPGTRESDDVFHYLVIGKTVTVYGEEMRDEAYRAVITTVEIKRDLSDFDNSAF